MKIKNISLLVTMIAMMALAVTTAQAEDVITFDQGNQLLTRWAADGTKIWEYAGQTHDMGQLEIGPDGAVYLAGLNDKRVFKYDAATGASLGYVAEDATTNRVSDITFGNDVDSDGIQDLYVATYTTNVIQVWTSSTGYTTKSDFATGMFTSRANVLDFGPDVTGDSVPDLFVVDGEANDSSNMMRVINGVTGLLDSSWSLANVRVPKDVVYGSDGRVYVASAGRNQVNSFLPDGTDERWNGVGINKDGISYPRQIAEGSDGKLYVANRLAGNQSTDPAITRYTASMLAFDGVVVEVAGADFSGVVTAPEIVEVDIITFDQGNQLLTRWAADGTKIWEYAGQTHDMGQLEIGPDGAVYLAGWTDKRVFRHNPATGEQINFVAEDSTTDRVSDITFGNDVDGDGMQDLYVATFTTNVIQCWTSSSGYNTQYPDPNGFSTGMFTSNANVLDFGPDVTGDSVPDIFVVDGDANNDTNMMRVINGATGALDSSWGLANVRSPKDVVVGSDNRVYVASASRNQVNSFALDGSDEKWNGSGINKDGMQYPRQIHENVNGTWYVANRFAGNQSTDPAVTRYTASMIAFDDVVVEVAGADFSGVVTAPALPEFEGADVVTFDQGNQLLTRWRSNGTKVWEYGGQTHDMGQLELGPDGIIYMAGWTDKRVFKFDPATGASLGYVANDATVDRFSDITFGNDVDNDGIEDLYAATLNSNIIQVWTSSSGYTANDPNANITGVFTSKANVLDFGPDVTGDSVPDLFVVDGEANNDTNMMRVINGATGALDSSWGLANVRSPKDVVVGSDDRVYVVSAGRNQVSSFNTDGTGERWNGNLINKDGMRYPRQIHEGVDGKWYAGNRFAGSESVVPYALGSANGGVTSHTANGMHSFAGLFIEVAGADFSGVLTLPVGCTLNSVADLDDDCDVDIDDLTVFVGTWLMSTDPAL